MGRVLRGMLVAVLSAVILATAGVVTFGCWSLYVQTVADPAQMQPGSLQYETREFWLSLRDWHDGRNESCTAEWPDILGGSP